MYKKHLTVYLRIQRLADLHSCQGALASLQVLNHHLAKSIAHVHLDTQIISCIWSIT